MDRKQLFALPFRIEVGGKRKPAKGAGKEGVKSTWPQLRGAGRKVAGQEGETQCPCTLLTWLTCARHIWLHLSSAAERRSIPYASVVKVFVTFATPNYMLPWQMGRQEGCTGSGFVLKDQVKHASTFIDVTIPIFLFFGFRVRISCFYYSRL